MAGCERLRHSVLIGIGTASARGKVGGGAGKQPSGGSSGLTRRRFLGNYPCCLAWARKLRSDWDKNNRQYEQWMRMRKPVGYSLPGRLVHNEAGSLIGARTTIIGASTTIA
jgi:hypothetical protein